MDKDETLWLSIDNHSATTKIELSSNIKFVS